MNPHIASLHIYPVKGARGIDLDSAAIGIEGLAAQGIGDREWMVTDRNYQFVSQRSGCPVKVRSRDHVEHDLARGADREVDGTKRTNPAPDSGVEGELASGDQPVNGATCDRQTGKRGKRSTHRPQPIDLADRLPRGADGWGGAASPSACSTL